MTQEEKELLLRDICARLPYGVKFQAEDSNVYTLDAANYFALQVEDVVFKPYLRPMSSMTEEEKEYIKNRWCYNDWDIDGPSSLWREKIDVEDAEWIVDYFNEHHLDFRGLIPMGLALEAPKDMYKTE